MRSENRNPKAERRPRSEGRNPKAEAGSPSLGRTATGFAVTSQSPVLKLDEGRVWMSGLGLRISVFGFPSVFGFRPSDFAS